MKEWILQYAEQQNEEEKSENSKSLDEEEKFDPVSQKFVLGLYLAFHKATYLNFRDLVFSFVN